MARRAGLSASAWCVGRLPGRGVSPRVELDYVEDGLSQRQPGELCDATSQQLIRFIAVNPFTYTQRDISVTNRMSVYTPISTRTFLSGCNAVWKKVSDALKNRQSANSRNLGAYYHGKTMKERHCYFALQRHTCMRAFKGPFLGLPGWAGTRKVKPIWILLKQETVSGIGISLAICKFASRSRQMTTPAPHHSVFTGQMPFLPPSQYRQSTELHYKTLLFSGILSQPLSRLLQVEPDIPKDNLLVSCMGEGRFL